MKAPSRPLRIVSEATASGYASAPVKANRRCRTCKSWIVTDGAGRYWCSGDSGRKCGVEGGTNR